jgi:hypothetical protein
MTNKECIDSWADSIIPAVFRAEDADPALTDLAPLKRLTP